MQSKRFFYTDEEKGFLKLNERKLMTHGQNTTNQKIWNLYVIILLIVCVHCAMCILLLHILTGLQFGTEASADCHRQLYR